MIDGLEEPLTCEEVDADCRELLASTLYEEPATELLCVPDAEALRTRFFPARRIILMDRAAASAESPEQAT